VLFRFFSAGCITDIFKPENIFGEKIEWGGVGKKSAEMHDFALLCR
jgi:hypothetical protein